MDGRDRLVLVLAVALMVLGVVLVLGSLIAAWATVAP